MYKLNTKREKAHDDAIWSVVWTARNEIITSSCDESVKVWNPDDLGKPLHVLNTQELAVISVAVDPTGNQIVSSCMDGYLRVHRLDSPDGKEPTLKKINAGPLEAWTVTRHPKEDVVATGNHAGGINIYDLKGLIKKGNFESEGKFTMSVLYSPCGTMLASGSFDGEVKLFDTASGKLLHKLARHNKAVRALAFSPDSKYLLSGSDDMNIHVYETHRGQQLGTLSGHLSWVLSVAFNATGTHFASSSSDKKIKVWNFRERECVHTFDAHSHQVWGVTFNPEGTKLASVSEDMSLLVFDCKAE